MDGKSTTDTKEIIQLPTVRRAYLPPELTTWGTLSKITQKVGYLGAADGGRFPLGYKTSF